MKGPVTLLICILFYFAIDYCEAEPQIGGRILNRGRNIISRAKDRWVDVGVNRNPLNADIRLAIGSSRDRGRSNRGSGSNWNNGHNEGAIDVGRRRNNGENNASGRRRNNGGIEGGTNGGRRRNNGANDASGRRNNGPKTDGGRRRNNGGNSSSGRRIVSGKRG